MMEATSRLSNQEKLRIISEDIVENIEEILDVFGVEELSQRNNKLVGACPIHGGDKKNAFNFFTDGDSVVGNWVCRTMGCEKTFVNTPIGLVRGLLSTEKYGWTKPGDKMAPFKEVVEWCEKFLNKNLDDIKVDDDLLMKSKFISETRSFREIQDSPKKITKKMLRSHLLFPCEYYIKRGFSEKILSKYDVGYCDTPNKEMYERAVVPIFSDDYKNIVGVSGRTIHPECILCGAYHKPGRTCPNENIAWTYSKWKHSKGFKAEDYLYNYWFAKNYIFQTKILIIVESPGNVWKLEEAGIHNSVALFGTSLNQGQNKKINKTGAMTIILAMDKGSAGESGAEELKEKLSRFYNIINYTPPVDDIAEMGIEEINYELIPIIRDAEEEINKCLL